MTALAPDLADLAREVRVRLAVSAIVGRTVALRRRGHEHSGLCPFHSEKTPSFTVNDRKGFFHCFGCGAHGDAVGFVMRAEGLDFPAAVKALAAEAGLSVPDAPARKACPRAAPPPPAERTPPAGPGRALSRSAAIWRAARPIAGSLAEAYLARRLGVAPLDFALLGGLPPTLRYHPGLDYWHGRGDRPIRLGASQALVAAVQAPGERPEGGRLTAVHVTWLAGPDDPADGKGRRVWSDPETGEVLPAKKILGPYSGGCCRLTPAAPRLVLPEGIETTLALWMAAAQAAADAERPLDVAFWASLSLGNLAGPGDPRDRGALRPDGARDQRGRPRRLPSRRPDPDRPGLWLPPCVDELTIAEDADNRDPAAAGALYDRAEARARAAGLRVRRARPPAGLDFCDLYAAGTAVGAGERAA